MQAKSIDIFSTQILWSKLKVYCYMYWSFLIHHKQHIFTNHPSNCLFFCLQNCKAALFKLSKNLNSKKKNTTFIKFSQTKTDFVWLKYQPSFFLKQSTFTENKLSHSIVLFSYFFEKLSRFYFLYTKTLTKRFGFQIALIQFGGKKKKCVLSWREYIEIWIYVCVVSGQFCINCLCLHAKGYFCHAKLKFTHTHTHTHTHLIPIHRQNIKFTMLFFNANYIKKLLTVCVTS